jgi:hypothetical protein
MMAYQGHSSLVDAKFVVTILVDGKPLREFREDDIRTVKIPFGSEYTIRIKSKYIRRAKASILIDGTEVFTGGKQLIIPALGTVDVERFVDSLDSGKKFKFVSIEEGTKTGQIQDPTSTDNGTIKIYVYPEIVSTVTYAMPTFTTYPRDFSVTCDSLGIGDFASTSTYVVNASVVGATVEGSNSSQGFMMSQDYFETAGSPVGFVIKLTAPTQETIPPPWTAPSVNGPDFKIRIKNGYIWVEDKNTRRVPTDYIGFCGDYVKIRTKDFAFADQFHKDCITLTKEGFDIRAYAKDRIFSE